jgi:hypothetical protein|tara:strand:- start:45 stop:377 length:333 start_codon:yes stop_codon:yes gene_type:complete
MKMRNKKVERIKASAQFLKSKSSDFGQAMNVYCQEFSRKIIKETNSLNRSMLTVTEINNFMYLIDMFKDIDGYYNDISDNQLDEMYKKLNLLKESARATTYEIKQNKLEE